MTSSVVVSVLQNTVFLARNKPHQPWSIHGILDCIIQLLLQHTRRSFKEEKIFCLLPKAKSSRNTLLFLQLKKIVYCLSWKCLYLMIPLITFRTLLCTCFENKDYVSCEMPFTWLAFKPGASRTRGVWDSEWNFKRKSK